MIKLRDFEFEMVKEEISSGEGEIKKTPTAKRWRGWSVWTVALITALITVLLATAVNTEVTTALTLAVKTAVKSRAAAKSFMFNNNDKSCQCSSQNVVIVR